MFNKNISACFFSILKLKLLRTKTNYLVLTNYRTCKVLLLPFETNNNLSDGGCIDLNQVGTIDFILNTNVHQCCLQFTFVIYNALKVRATVIPIATMPVIRLVILKFCEWTVVCIIVYPCSTCN